MYANCNVILAFASFLGSSTSIFDEAKALRVGLIRARCQDISHLWIESDSTLLVNCLNEFFAVPWSITYLVRNIFVLLQGFVACNLTHINREGYSIADSFAN